MRITRTARLASAFAIAALAVGLSACEEEVTTDGPVGSASASEAAGSSGGQTTKTGDVIQDIEPITFYDAEIGLTETCDQIIQDFNAPNYKATTSINGTVYLLHCTFTSDGKVPLEVETVANVILVNEDNNLYNATAQFSSNYEADYKAAGIEGIGFDDYGTYQATGWIPLWVQEFDGKIVPMPAGNTTVKYERRALENSATGEIYNAYSNSTSLVIK